MDKIELGLNNKKPGNYGFFCPVSKLHLTLSNPIGSVNADRVTSYILRGIKTKVLIDMNGVVNLDTGEVNSKQKPTTGKAESDKKSAEVEPQKEDISDVKTEESKVEEPKAEEPKVEEVKVEKAKEEKTETKPASKRGKRAEAKVVDEAAEQPKE